MEGDLPRGPVSRWQRKAQEQGVNYLSINNENSEHLVIYVFKHLQYFLDIALKHRAIAIMY